MAALLHEDLAGELLRHLPIDDSVQLLKTKHDLFASHRLWLILLRERQRIHPLACSRLLDLSMIEIPMLRKIAYRTLSLVTKFRQPVVSPRSFKSTPTTVDDEHVLGHIPGEEIIATGIFHLNGYAISFWDMRYETCIETFRFLEWPAEFSVSETWASFDIPGIYILPVCGLSERWEGKKLVLLCVDFATRSSPFAYELHGIEMPAGNDWRIGTLIEGMLPVTILDSASGLLKFAALDVLALHDAGINGSRSSAPISFNFNTMQLPKDIVSSITIDSDESYILVDDSFLWKHTFYVVFTDATKAHVLYSFPMDAPSNDNAHCINFNYQDARLHVFDGRTQPNLQLLLFRTSTASSPGTKDSVFGQVCTLSAIHDPEVHLEHYTGGANNPEYTCTHSRAFSSSGMFDMRIRTFEPLDPEGEPSYSLELAVRHVPEESSTALPTWSTHELACPDKLKGLEGLYFFGLKDRFRIDDHLGIIYLILRPGHIHTLSYS